MSHKKDLRKYEPLSEETLAAEMRRINPATPFASLAAKELLPFIWGSVSASKNALDKLVVTQDQGFYFRDSIADIEDRLGHSMDNDCPTCGGSGHIDDTDPTAAMVGSMVEPGLSRYSIRGDIAFKDADGGYMLVSQTLPYIERLHSRIAEVEREAQYCHHLVEAHCLDKDTLKRLLDEARER